MKKTFLHLSDLHYRPNWHEEVGLVISNFFEDLTAQERKYSDLYLIFSGDLINTGEVSEHFEQLRLEFFNKLPIPLDRRIFAPGNHDVSRSTLKPMLIMQQGALEKINSESDFNNNLNLLSENIFNKTFKNYIEFERAASKYTCCQENIGGTGWSIGDGVGIYCLNSALGSSSGLDDLNGNEICDKEKLFIDTRNLYKWIYSEQFEHRILVMHHPVSWLTEWAQIELEKIISKYFCLVVSGHAHRGLSTFSSHGVGGSVNCSAPALFSRKSELLGYSFITLDTSNKDLEICYRQWSPSQSFVSGTSFSGTDTGIKKFNISNNLLISGLDLPIEHPAVSQQENTLHVLEAEFNETITCYSSKNKIWVDRDLATKAETDNEGDTAIVINLESFLEKIETSIIRAPKQFGLSSVGRWIALNHFIKTSHTKPLIMLNFNDVPNEKSALIKHINLRCKELNINILQVGGFILDNWVFDKKATRLFQSLQKEFPSLPIIMLHGVDNFTEIADTIENAEQFNCPAYFLWALTRNRVRELVCNYTKDNNALDEDIVTEKIIRDIDSLNIHRTPLNCLLLLKFNEQAFEESPVNRTEMIGRVLFMLFFQFDAIPRYATRPDLKDCEYALGYLSECLLRKNTSSFTKKEFFDYIQEYCKSHLLDLDCEILFTILTFEKILIQKNTEYQFRFTYWLYFFAAHRMHHDENFADYILSEKRYAIYPEIIEFYTGIDRRRINAIKILITDLKLMNANFLLRTGIADDFNPFQTALWKPSSESLEKLRDQVNESVSESALPQKVKDAIADQSYDRAKPYSQELASYIESASLYEMVQSMKGAARALRNSDHVSPEVKKELLNLILTCWLRVAQILSLLSPLLATRKYASFEGMNFQITEDIEQIEQGEKRWSVIMSVIIDNVVKWFQEDLFSKKMGALFSSQIKSSPGHISEVLLLIVICRLRPPGWEKELEDYITRTPKNSFYLSRIFHTLRNEYISGPTKESIRQQLRRLSAITLAKHDTGVKHPNLKLIERAAAAIESTPEKEPIHKHTKSPVWRDYRKK
ncbi:MAG: metallophosphoesterase [Holophagaceae bacterium]